MFTLNICSPAGCQQVLGDVAGVRRWLVGWQDTYNHGLCGLFALSRREPGDTGGSLEQQQCKADGTEIRPPVDGKDTGFASFSMHRICCWNSILSSLLMTQNYNRGLNCWVLPYRVFNLLVISTYALKQWSLRGYKFLSREKALFLFFWIK